MIKKVYAVIVSAVMILAINGCTTYTTRVDNTPGTPTTYESPQAPGAVQGVGMETQDIISMTDRMVRDILANPFWVSHSGPPRIIVDANYFANDSSTIINKNLITDRLRVDLNRAAAGRMIFVGRHYANMVEHERMLKQQGVVDAGTKKHVDKTLGADYRLGGRITTRDAVTPNTGIRSRYTQIVFELVDLQQGAIVWSGIYGFRKTSRDSVIYR